MGSERVIRPKSARHGTGALRRPTKVLRRCTFSTLGLVALDTVEEVAADHADLVATTLCSANAARAS